MLGLSAGDVMIVVKAMRKSLVARKTGVKTRTCSSKLDSQLKQISFRASLDHVVA